MTTGSPPAGLLLRWAAGPCSARVCEGRLGRGVSLVDGVVLIDAVCHRRHRMGGGIHGYVCTEGGGRVGMWVGNGGREDGGERERGTDERGHIS